MTTQTRTLRLGPNDHGRTVSAGDFTIAEFAEPWVYEREQGRLLVLAPEGKDHIRASNPWLDRLITYKLSHPGRIEEVVSQAWVRVRDGGDRIGDIGVYLARSSGSLETPEQVPELMFAIVSGGRVNRERDFGVKRVDYYSVGVREYVIVDRFTRLVTVLRWAVDGYHKSVLREGDRYTTALLPGLEIAQDEVF